MAAGGSLAVLKLRIYWHGGVGGWVDEMQIKAMLSQLGCSWGLAELGNIVNEHSRSLF